MDRVKQIVDPKNHDKFDKKIPNKEFLLGKFYDASLSSFMKSRHKCSHKKFPKSKTAKTIENQMRISEKIKGKQQFEELHSKYEFYLPLNNLWREYATQLIERQPNQESRELKVLRGDFYGAYVVIVESKNSTLLGVSGIVIRETLKTFDIILDPTIEESIEEVPGIQKHKNSLMNNNQKPILTVLKSICIFLVVVGHEHSFLINGSSLVYRPSDRIRHKFKFRKGEKMNFKFLEHLNTQQEVHQEEDVE